MDLCEPQASQGHTMRPCFKIKKEKEKKSEFREKPELTPSATLGHSETRAGAWATVQGSSSPMSASAEKQKVL